MTSPDELAAAHHAPEFRKKWPRFGELVKEVDPCLYDEVHVEAAYIDPWSFATHSA